VLDNRIVKDYIAFSLFNYSFKLMSVC